MIHNGKLRLFVVICDDISLITNYRITKPGSSIVYKAFAYNAIGNKRSLA